MRFATFAPSIYRFVQMEIHVYAERDKKTGKQNSGKAFLKNGIIVN